MKHLILLAGLILSTTAFAQSKQDDEDVMNRPGSRLTFEGARVQKDPLVILYRSAEFLENRALQGLERTNPDCYARIQGIALVHVLQDRLAWFRDFGPNTPSAIIYDNMLLINNQDFFGGSISPIDQLINACRLAETEN